MTWFCLYWRHDGHNHSVMAWCRSSWHDAGHHDMMTVVMAWRLSWHNGRHATTIIMGKIVIKSTLSWHDHRHGMTMVLLTEKTCQWKSLAKGKLLKLVKSQKQNRLTNGVVKMSWSSKSLSQNFFRNKISGQVKNRANMNFSLHQMLLLFNK